MSRATPFRASALVGLLTVGLLFSSPGARPAGAADGRLFVLMVNGGGSREDNFQSHIDHLRELTAHLRRAGVPADRLTILAGDGEDPARDLATRRDQLPRAWMLEGTGFERDLGEPIRFISSEVPGMTLRPATRKELTRYLREARTHMAAGDTLLLYVTDHGQQDRRDHLRNRITLWGAREAINVRQLGAELTQLPRGVRVVTVMSQCFSGAFAELPSIIPRGTGWQGPVCGYFASTPDRPAYGCFPESNSENRTGHAFTLIDALGQHTRLPEVHAAVLLNDESPDVPLRTSDLFLRDLLDRTAAAAGLTPEAAGDQLLAKVRPADKQAPAELAMAQQLARAYDAAAPLTLTSLDQQLDQLDDARAALTKHQGLWEGALADQVRAQMDDFLALHPAWEPRLRPNVLRKLDDEARRALARELLTELEGFSGTVPALRTLLTDLLDRSNRSAELLYRLEVREAVFMRIRILLTSAAGRLQLRDDSDGAPPRAAERGRARTELAALDACEALDLPPAPRAQGTTAPPALPVPSRLADQTSSAQMRPAWLGIAFRVAPEGLRRRHQLAAGAAQITTVVPRSPAAQAGLMVGDIIVGPPGNPFTRPNQVRAFTMLSDPATPVQLELLRQGARRQVKVQLSLLPP